MREVDLQDQAVAIVSIMATQLVRFLGLLTNARSLQADRLEKIDSQLASLDGQ